MESDSVQKTSPTRSLNAIAVASAAAVVPADDNFLTLKYVRDGFCLDKKLEKKVKKRSVHPNYEEEPWLRPKLELDDFDYDFTLERSVLRDYN